MKSTKIIPALFFLLGAFLLTLSVLSCTKIIYIASDNPDFVFAADAYNTKFKRKQVVVYIEEDILSPVSKKAIHFVVSRVDSVKKQELLSGLNFAPIIQGTSQKITKPFNNMDMLAFSLPLVIKQKSANIEFPDFRYENKISLFELQTISSETSFKKNNNDMYRLNFYPVDDSFHEVFDSAKTYTDWMIQAQLNSEELMQYYQNNYGPVPLIAILQDENIVFKYISSNKFFALPKELRDNFDVYFLTDNEGRISMIQAVYLGYLEKGIKNSIAAPHFLKWIESEEGQMSIIAAKKQFASRDETIFLDSTLSTFWNVNKTILFRENLWLEENQPLFHQLR